MPLTAAPYRRLIAALAVLFTAATAPHAAAQATTGITVTGDIPAPLTLSAADLAAMPRASVTATYNGVTTTFHGVWLADVLKRAGAPLGPGPHAHSLTGYVVAKASDGYQVVFSLGELDPAITDQQVLLADRANDGPLPAEHGSFRLVLPKDKRGSRSMRLLSALEINVLKR